MASRLRGVAVLVLMSRLDSGGAVFGRDKGKGGVGGGLSSPNRITLTPQVLKEGSMKVANEIMNWGTSAVFQLKRVAQMKGHTERLRVELGAVEKDDSPVKIDNPMYKDVVQGAVGDVFLKLNSPGMGKLSKKTQERMKDRARQKRTLAVDRRIKGSKKAFLEGALLNRDVNAAHDSFMADVEVLLKSKLAKKVAASAEAYHDAMLEYTTSEGTPKLTPLASKT